MTTRKQEVGTAAKSATLPLTPASSSPSSAVRRLAQYVALTRTLPNAFVAHFIHFASVAQGVALCAERMQVSSRGMLAHPARCQARSRNHCLSVFVEHVVSPLGVIPDNNSVSPTLPLLVLAQLVGQTLPLWKIPL